MYECWIGPIGHGTFSEQDFETHSLLHRRAAQAYAMTLILNCEPKIQTLLSLNWLQFRSLCNSNRNSGNDNENDSGNDSNRIPNTSNPPVVLLTWTLGRGTSHTTWSHSYHSSA